jgi:hypothetical protein
MGFWGTYIVGCSDLPLTELEALRAESGKVVWQRQGDDGWQVIQVHQGPDGWSSATLPAEWEKLLVSVMDQTRRPVLAAVVLDEDGAQLIGYSPAAGRWGGWLMLERILPHLDRRALPSAYEDEDGETQVDLGEDYQRLCREIMDDLHQRVGPAAPRAAELAGQWAIEAGLDPDIAAITNVLGSTDVFASDLFFVFLGALGMRSLSGSGG